MLGLSRSTSGCQPREEHSGQRTAGDRPLVGAHAGCGALAVWTCRGRPRPPRAPKARTGILRRVLRNPYESLTAE